MATVEVPAGYPKWVDKFYFSDILRKDYSSCKVIRFNVSPLNGKGENYASSMYRVKLSVESGEAGLVHRNFVVKANLQTTMDPAIASIFNVFPKEIQMYTDILPQFEGIFESVSEKVQFGPK